MESSWTMSSKLPLSTFILIFALTILNCWWHLGQSIPDLTASPLFDQKRQIDELQNRSDENNHDLYSRGGGKKQDEVVMEKKEKKEKERGNVKEGGLLDWLLEQQERKATLAAACAKDPRWEKYIFRHLRHNKKHLVFSNSPDDDIVDFQVEELPDHKLPQRFP